MMRSSSSHLRQIALVSLQQTLGPGRRPNPPGETCAARRRDLETAAWQAFGALSPSVARSMPVRAQRSPARGTVGALEHLLVAVAGR